MWFMMKFKTIDELMVYSEKILGKSINDVVDENENLESVHGHFFLLPDPDSFSTIFKTLGVAL